MIWIIPALAFAFVLLYFILVGQRKNANAGWQRIRERQRQRKQNPPAEQPIDPNFVFDERDPLQRPNQDDHESPGAAAR
jgi:hypothetical protein